MNAYEYVDNGGRVLCKNHHKLRCDECEYTYDLEQQNKRYREAIEEAMDLLGQPGMIKMSAYVILEKALEEESY